MLPVRIRFSKRGRARFISHLDLNRCMSRALRRSGISVWYTQGFNPHPYITFALPLSLFYESECEVMDMRLNEAMPLDDLCMALDAQMPEGIHVLEVAEPVMKTKVITFASYKIALEFSGVDAEKLRKSFQKLIALPELLMEKKTKRAVRMIDIHPWFEKAEPIFEENLLELKAILPAGQMETINPNCFTAILEQYVQLKPDLDHICRTGIFNEQMQSFH